MFSFGLAKYHLLLHIVGSKYTQLVQLYTMNFALIILLQCLVE